MPGVDDNFRVVTRRNRFRQRVDHRLFHQQIDESDPEINTDQLLRKILDAVITIRNSSYRKILYDNLDKSLNILNVKIIPDIVCYGLGNFSESRSAKYQLAALLTIKSQYSSKVYIYDPVFYKKELELLKILGLTIIEYNEEAKRKIIDNNVTLFYMPHCYRGLIANCLYANWNLNLINCIIITNSFNQMNDDNLVDEELRNAAELIRKINPYTVEIIIDDQFEPAQEAFTSTSLHIFPKLKTQIIPPDFWILPDNPPFHDDINIHNNVNGNDNEVEREN